MDHQEFIILNIPALIRLFALTALSAILAFLWTPFLTNLLYKYNWRKRIRQGETPIYSSLHAQKAQTPTMGGLLIWLTVMVVTLLFNLSREQTWLSLFALVAAGIVGAFDDLLNIKGIGPQGGGLGGRHKLLIQLLIAGIGAWWFAYKLDWVYRPIHIPGVGDYILGIWFILLFILVIVATTNAVNITDGLDGLAGGLLALAYMAYGVIAFVQNQLGIAVFCGCIAGALLAFLWFNIYPARFFMGDTGSMSLGATLGVVAMLTNQVLVLPIIGFVFVIETLSVILQIFWRKFFKKKLFLSTPLHHHLEAQGWPETKVTMRLWVIGAVFAVIGMVIALIGRG